MGKVSQITRITQMPSGRNVIGFPAGWLCVICAICETLKIIPGLN